MHQPFPKNLLEFQRRFSDEDACAAYLFERRWPDGFVCPWCGHAKGWALKTKAHTWECAGCGQQTSITANTVMHRSKLPLTVWFWAAFLLATHSNGISALQLSKQLGVTYKTAWLLLAKLRRCLVDPDRSLLDGVVEVDETIIPCRTNDQPLALPGGRSLKGKIAIAGAVEVRTRTTRKGIKEFAGRVRLKTVKDFTDTSLIGFVEDHVRYQSTVITDGWTAYDALDGECDLHGNILRPANFKHVPRTVGAMAANVLLPWVHRVFANLQRWGLGVYHGLRLKYINSYLDEFVFRFNRRRSRHAAFDTVLGIAMRRDRVTRKDLMAGSLAPVRPFPLEQDIPFPA
jgi:hypothetical protein